MLLREAVTSVLGHRGYLDIGDPDHPLPHPLSALAWLLPCDLLDFLTPNTYHSPLPGGDPWPGFETLRVSRP